MPVYAIVRAASNSIETEFPYVVAGTSLGGTISGSPGRTACDRPILNYCEHRSQFDRRVKYLVFSNAGRHSRVLVLRRFDGITNMSILVQVSGIQRYCVKT